MLRALAALLLLAVAMPAIAANPNVPHPLKPICRDTLPAIRLMWSRGILDVPPGVDALMLDVIDGKVDKVREQLQDMPTAEQNRWRQLALITAAVAEQSAVVEDLLDNGADVDGSALFPPFKAKAFQEITDAMRKDPRFGSAKSVDRLEKTGVIHNGMQRMGPAIVLAAGCGDIATVDVLLRHHANVNTSSGAHIVDALVLAVSQGNASIIRNLLDRGADPCHENRRFTKRAGKPAPTISGIAAQNGLPPALVKRLVCHRSAPAG